MEINEGSPTREKKSKKKKKIHAKKCSENPSVDESFPFIEEIGSFELEKSSNPSSRKSGKKNEKKKKKSDKKNGKSQGDTGLFLHPSENTLEMRDVEDRKMTSHEIKALNSNKSLLRPFLDTDSHLNSENDHDIRHNDYFGSLPIDEKSRLAMHKDDKAILHSNDPQGSSHVDTLLSNISYQQTDLQAHHVTSCIEHNRDFTFIDEQNSTYHSDSSDRRKDQDYQGFINARVPNKDWQSISGNERDTSTNGHVKHESKLSPRSNWNGAQLASKYHEEEAYALGSTSHSCRTKSSAESTFLTENKSKNRNDSSFSITNVIMPKTQRNMETSSRQFASNTRLSGTSEKLNLSKMYKKAVAASRTTNLPQAQDASESQTPVEVNSAQARSMIRRHFKPMGTENQTSMQVITRFQEEQARNSNDRSSLGSESQTATSFQDEEIPVSNGFNNQQNLNPVERRSRARARLAQRGLLWERSSQPGAVQVAGRAFGAPLRPELRRDPEIQDEVVAETVEVIDTTPVVYAESTTLSWKELLKENSIRRRILFLFFVLITIVTISVTLVVLKGPGSIDVDDSHETVSPTFAPSSSPTYISPDIFDYTVNLSGLKQVKTSGTPQHLAIGWLSTFDTFSDDLGEMFEQRYALVTFFFAVGGSNWVEQENWLRPDIHECDWSGSISCAIDGTGRRIVNGLDLTRNGLIGSLPKELSLCRHLETMRLPKNEIQGSIPKEIFRLTSLQVLDLSNNLFSASLPNDMGKEDNLVHLDLSNNNLSGSIPDSLQNLTLLRVVDFSGNQLTGPLPANLTLLKTISRLSLASNLLSGSLPDYPSDKFPAFDVLDLGENQLTGTLPPWFLLLLQRQEIRLNSNFFSGTIPTVLNDTKDGKLIMSDEFWQDIQLIRIDISNNEISGSIPNWINRLPTIEHIDFSSNRLSNTVPLSDDKTQGLNLEYLNFADNQLSGEIPTLSRFKLSFLDLSGNKFIGKVSLNSSTLQFLLLENNTELTIDLNLMIQSAGNLKTLNLRNTSITGTIHNEDVLKLSNIEILDLSFNRISGSIPGEIGNLSTLKKIILCNNQLSGSIPSEIGNLEYLQFLHMEENLLVGTLPQALGLMSSLESLEFAGNNLSGGLPEGLCQSTSMNLSLSQFGCNIVCECCTSSDNLC